MSERDCLEDSENKDHGFLIYQAIGAEALASGKLHMDASSQRRRRVGHPQNGFVATAGIRWFSRHCRRGRPDHHPSRVVALGADVVHAARRSRTKPGGRGPSVVHRRISGCDGEVHFVKTVGFGRTPAVEQRRSALAKPSRADGGQDEARAEIEAGMFVVVARRIWRRVWPVGLRERRMGGGLPHAQVRRRCASPLVPSGCATTRLGAVLPKNIRPEFQRFPR